MNFIGTIATSVAVSAMLLQTGPIYAEPVTDEFISICRDAGEGGLEGFPDICRLRDGRLITVFYAGYAHVSPPNNILPRGGRIHYCFSSDEGRTWSEPGLLYDGPIDDRDPSVMQLESGRLLCTFFHSAKGTWRGTWVTVSDDGAKSWSEPKKLTPSNYFCSSPIRAVSSGRLILPLYKLQGDVANGAVMISDDAGMNWSAPIDIDSAGAFLDAETDIIELKDRRLYALQRGTRTRMHFSISTDRGETWSQSQPLDFRGISPYLLRVSDEIVIVTYGQIGSDKPNGTVLRYSLDECQSWSEATLVAKPAGTHPSLVLLKDGSVLVVYYDQGRADDVRARLCSVTKRGIEWQTIIPSPHFESNH